MDIFTTQLTRVVPVPIKSEKLKVKALVKEAAIKKLKADINGAEEHDYYLKLSQKKKEQHSSGEASNEADNTEENVISAGEGNEKYQDQRHFTQKQSEDADDHDKPHLDIYI